MRPERSEPTPLATDAPDADTAPRGFLSGGGRDNPALAAVLMVGSLGLLGLQDALVKFTSDSVSLWAFQLLRSSMNLGLLLVLSRVLWGRDQPRARRMWAVALRSFLLVGSMLLLFGGIPYLSLAKIAAGLYVFPLFIAVLSYVLLREPVGPRRITAIVAGLAGALMILQPAADDFSPVALMPVGAAVCYACTILTTRSLCRDESPVVLAFGVALAFLFVGGSGVILLSIVPTPYSETWPYLFTGWRPLEFATLGLIAVCSCLNLAANIGLAKAYQSAEASWLAPFDYSYLIFATFWGFYFFGGFPNALTLAGMAVIAASGGYVAWRERQEKRLPRANLNRNLR